MSDGSLIFDTKINEKGFEKGTEGIIGSTKKIAGAIAGAFAVKKVAEFGTQAIDLASDLQEVQNVVDTVFGKSSKEIDDFSKDAIEKFGLSELSAKQFSSTMGALLKPTGLATDKITVMAKTLTGASGGMASFFNKTSDVIQQDLQSYFAGSAETMLKYGLDAKVANLESFALAKGIKKSWTEMSQAEQQTLRYDYLVKNLGYTFNDFEKTQDSYANQTKVLNERWKEFLANIGTKILPLITPIVGILNDFITNLGNIGSVLSGIDFSNIITAFNNLKSAVQPFAENLFSGLKWFYDNILVPFGTFVITDIVPGFLNAISGALSFINAILVTFQPLGIWLWENFLQPLANWTGGVIADTLLIIGDALKVVSAWIINNQGIIEAFGIAIGIVAGAIAAFNAAILIWNVIGIIATGVTTAFGVAVAFLTSPITLVIGAIVLLIAIIVLLYKNWDKVKALAGEVWDWIVDKWKGAGEWIKTNVVDPIAKFFTGMWDGIKNKAYEIWESIKKLLLPLTTWIDTNIIQPFSKLFSGMWDGIKESFNTVFGAIESGFKIYVNIWIGLIEGFVNMAIKGLNLLIGAFGDLSFDIPDWVPLIGGNSFGINIPKISEINIPRLATGAVIPPNSEFLAMLGDQTRGNNIEAPESLIRKIIKEEMGSNQININFTGDLSALARVLKPEIDRENIRKGRSMTVRSATI